MTGVVSVGSLFQDDAPPPQLVQLYDREPLVLFAHGLEHREGEAHGRSSRQAQPASRAPSDSWSRRALMVA